MTKHMDSSWIKPIQRQNLSDLAYGELRDALMRGKLKPGQSLPLRPVSQSFGISATPMREALMRLIAEHALELDARGRVCVPHLTRNALMEIRGLREQLEGGAAVKAAQCASPENIDALESIHFEMIAAQDAGALDEAIAQNTRFHLKLCEIADGPVTLDLVLNLWMRCGPLLSYLYASGTPPNWDPHPHLKIVTAIREGDSDAARQALILDIRGNGAGILAHAR